MKSRIKGFTLVELLAIIVILSLLLVILVPAINSAFFATTEKLSVSKISFLEAAAQKYANDNINSFQKCEGDKNVLPENCVQNISDITSKLVDEGYISPNDAITLNDKTGDDYDGNIVFCFRAKDVSIDAKYFEDDGYGCSINTGVSYLKFSENSGIAYENSTKEVNVLHFGLTGNLEFTSSLDNINLSFANNLLTVRVGKVDFGDEDEVRAKITAKGYFGDNSTEIKSEYELLIKKVDFSLETYKMFVEVNNSSTIQVSCSNCGNFSYTSSNNLTNSNISNNTLSIRAYDTTGVDSLTIREANAGKEVTIQIYIYKMKILNNTGSAMQIGDTRTYDLDVGGLTNIDFEIGDESLIGVELGENSFKVNALRNGETTVTLSGYILLDGEKISCKSLTINIKIEDLDIRLDKDRVELFVGGDSATSNIYFNNDNLNLYCSSSDVSAATCSIENNVLTITSGSQAKDDVTVTVYDEKNIKNSILYVNTKNITLYLDKSNVTLYAGNEAKLLEIHTNASKTITCSSSNENAATCQIENNLLKIYPHENTSNNSVHNDEFATISINIGTIVSTSINVTVKWVTMDILDSSRNRLTTDGNIGTFCRNIDDDVTDQFIIDGANIGDISLGAYDTDVDWYLASVDLNSNNFSVALRQNICEELGTCENTLFRQDGKNTGISRINMLESNSNKRVTLNYRIYSLDISGNDEISKDGIYDYDIYYSYLSDEYNPNSNYVPNILLSDNLELISTSAPSKYYGTYEALNNSMSDEEARSTNIIKKVTVRVRAKSVGQGYIRVNGEICSKPEEKGIVVISDATCPTVSSYSGIYDGTDKSISVSGNALNGTANYSLDGTNYTASLPRVSSVGNHTVYIKTVGNNYYNDKICDNSSINIRNAKINFINENENAYINGETVLYTRLGSSQYYTGDYSSTIGNYSIPTVEAVGHNFDGWYNKSQSTKIISSSGSILTNTSYADNSGMWSITSDIELYAKISPKTYTITYDANGGVDAPSNQTITFGISYNLSSVTPTWAGHSFLGWSEDKNASNYTFEAGESDKTDYRNINLYAVWSLNSYTFNINLLEPDGSEPWSTCEAGTFDISYDGGNTWNQACNESSSTIYYGQKVWIKNIVLSPLFKLESVSNMTLDGDIYKLTVSGDTTINISTSLKITSLPKGNYNKGQELNLFGLSWLVVEDSGDKTTLVLKDSYNSGVFGSNATFEGSTIYTNINTTFVDNNEQLGLARSMGLLERQGTYNSSDYYIRLLNLEELSTNLPLSNSTYGSVFWTQSVSDGNIYLGDSTGNSANAYFTDTGKGSIDLYAHDSSSCISSYSGGGWSPSESYNCVSDASKVAESNSYWESNSPTTLKATPSNGSITYYSNNSSTSAMGCKDLTEVIVGICTLYSFNGKGEYTYRYWRYGPSSSNSSRHYIENMLESQSKDICVKNSTTSFHVYYALNTNECWDTSRSSSYATVKFATNPVTYYKPTGNEITTNIGYRPVITVLEY